MTLVNHFHFQDLLSWMENGRGFNLDTCNAEEMQKLLVKLFLFFCFLLKSSYFLQESSERQQNENNILLLYSIKMLFEI